MHPLLMDAVVAARQAELRRSARRPRFGRRGSPARATSHPETTSLQCGDRTPGTR